MYRAVLFDLDGTLADTLKDLALCANAALESLSLPPRDIKDYRFFAGNGVKNMLSRAAGNADAELLSKLYSAFTEIYRARCLDNTAAYPDLPEVIDLLFNRGIKLAVVTNKDDEPAKRIVKSLYGEKFAAVEGKSEKFPLKPDPSLPFYIMKKLSVLPEECVFVGDSAVDIETALACGALPVGVLWGFRGREELLSAGAEYIITRPSQLLDIIGVNS